MQQATVNLLADMGVQPATLQTGLHGGHGLDRHHGADRRRSPRRPPARASPNGKTVTITRHRHRQRRRRGRRRRGLHRRRHDLAPGHRPRPPGRYTWTPAGAGPGHDQDARDRRQRQHRDRRAPGRHGQRRRCPCALFGAAGRAGDPGGSDATPRRAGRQVPRRGRRLRHRRALLQGHRQHRHAHRHLWTADGTLLATATFTSETATGWQQVDLRQSPVAITAGHDLRRLVLRAERRTTPRRRLLRRRRRRHRRRCTRLGDGTDGGNGVYGYAGGGAASRRDTYKSRNYWVDVVFTTVEPPDTTAPAVILARPRRGPPACRRPSMPSVTFGEPVQPAIGVVHRSGPPAAPPWPGAPPSTRTGPASRSSPTGSLPAGDDLHGDRDRRQDAAGEPDDALRPNSFTTAKPRPAAAGARAASGPTTPRRRSTPPNDPTRVELGVQVPRRHDGSSPGSGSTRDAATPAPTPARSGPPAGTLLATATFSGETAPAGRGPLLLAGPGHGGHRRMSRRTTRRRLALRRRRRPAPRGRRPAAARHRRRGRRRVTPTARGAFPDQSYNSTNYWVDVVFTLPPDPRPRPSPSTNPGRTTRRAFRRAPPRRSPSARRCSPRHRRSP